MEVPTLRAGVQDQVPADAAQAPSHRKQVSLQHMRQRVRQVSKTLHTKATIFLILTANV